MDGAQSTDDLFGAMRELVNQGALTVQKEGISVEPGAESDVLLRDSIRQQLARFTRQSLLCLS